MTEDIRTVDGAAAVRRWRIGRFIADSFDHMEANVFLAGTDPVQRPEITGRFFGILAEYAADGGGRVDYVTDQRGELVATAVWLDRTGDPPPIPDYDRRLAAATGEFLPRFQELDDVLHAQLPAEKHWHLLFLAVRRDRWGGGLGSTLMAHGHREIDRHGHSVYLEATSSRSAALYRRHGYTDMDPFVVKVSSVPFYRMWRPARIEEAAQI
jgi:ribosomal protein S18 acetylase RimI-like enzyme